MAQRGERGRRRPTPADQAHKGRHLITAAVKHSEAWFGKALTPATVRAMHTPLVRPSEKYEPVLRLKVSAHSVKLWRLADRSPATPDELAAKGATLVPLVTIGDVWFLNKANFGLSLGLQAALVAKPPALGLDAFVDLDSMED